MLLFALRRSRPRAAPFCVRSLGSQHAEAAAFGSVRCFSQTSALKEAKSVPGIYVANVEGRQNSSPILLGLADYFERHLSSVGFFQPVAGEPFPNSTTGLSRHIDLMRSAFNMKQEASQQSGISAKEAAKLLSTGQTDELMDVIYNKYVEYRKQHDLVIIEGLTGFEPGLGNVNELNAKVAATLETPVLLVLDSRTKDGFSSANDFGKLSGYDLILRDAVMWPAALLEDLLGVPSVEVIPLPLSSMYSKSQSMPNPISYIPQLGTSLTPNMNFWQRAQNYVVSFLTPLLLHKIHGSQAEFVKATGRSFRLHQTGVSSAAAVIAVVDWALEYPQPVPPRLHLVGPVLAQDSKPVTRELDSFLSQGLSQGHGAVFVSMGTLARMNRDELHSMAQALSALPNPVLWKLNPLHLPVHVTMEALNLGTNIKLIDWAPQNDVLGHPAVKAFLTHAGINSLYEAAYHGKPIVSVPLIVDQPANAAKAEYHGFGLTVDPSKLSPVNSKPLKAALMRILDEPAFTESAKKVQKRLINKPRHPAQVAADVVEQVLRTGAQPYLETMQHKLSWWQLSLLDVKLFLATVVSLVVVLALCVVASVVRVCVKGIQARSSFQKKVA